MGDVDESVATGKSCVAPQGMRVLQRLTDRWQSEIVATERSWVALQETRECCNG